MVCSQCGAQNKATARFCAHCGSAVGRACPTCSAAVEPGQRFCDECGTALAGSAARVHPAATVSAPRQSRDDAGPIAERRVCSIVFADLVGFTPLAEGRDPEDVREILSRYFDTARTVIGRYGGVVEKFIGDAVMAVWGTPTAAEGDAERAVRAALDLVDAVGQLGRDIGTEGLSARAGVVTGSVAVTLGADGEGMVAGDAVNTAARVQAAAQPGTVLVDESTWRVARAAVSFTAAGPHTLKGKADDVPLWRAERVLSGVGGSQRVDGLEAAFVGRDAELRLVKELFHSCVDRRSPRLVSVTGAAGVGKSRLGWEFFKYIDGLADVVLWHRGRCLSYGDGVAFWALAEMVRQRLGIAEEDAVEVAGDKLAVGLERWVRDDAERAYVEPRLAQLLGTETSAGQTLGRDELFAGWRLFFERLAQHAPVVLLVEDLHHADAGVLDFCEHLLDWARDVPIFVLTLARPELESRRLGWGAGRRNGTALSLAPLDAAAMGDLLDGLVPGMPPTAKKAIADRAEGVPLYAVETIRMLIDRDAVQPVDGVYRLVGNVGDLAVPVTLQSLLASRLDAFDPDVRRLVADAAVLGATFPREALVAVSGRPAEEVDRILSELVRREVLAVRADPLSPQRGQYAFVQTMLRQVAHDTLSRRERKSRHLAIAAHLQETFAGGGEEMAEVIAAHLLDALGAVPDDADVPELRAAAVDMLTRAGERARRTGAPAAAARAFAAAGQLLRESGTSADELAAAALLERAGEAAGEVDFPGSALHYETAAAIHRRHEKPRAAARADTGRARALAVMGQQEEARQLLRDALDILDQEPDFDTVQALTVLGGIESIAAVPGAGRTVQAGLRLAQDIGCDATTLAALLTHQGNTYTFTNRWVEAVAYHREAQRIAELAGDSGQIGHTLLNLSDALAAVDPAGAAEAGRGAVTHCRRVGASYRLGFAIANLMLALIDTGDWDEAQRAYRTGVDDDGIGDSALLHTGGALLHALRGDAPAVAADVVVVERGEDPNDPQSVAGTATVRAAAATCIGDHRRALQAALDSLTRVGQVGLRTESTRWGWLLAADAALAVGDDHEVERLLEWLAAHPPGHVPPALHAHRFRVRAELLASRGDPSAGDAFASAQTALRALAMPYHLAVGLAAEARFAAARDDSDAARRLVAEAAEIATRLGAKPLLDGVQTLASELTAAEVSRS